MKDFAAARNVALRAATQPWILVLDSDEFLSPELQGELVNLLRSRTDPAAYLVPRRYILENGAVIRHATTYPNERIYFFHRDTVEEWERPVHERVRLKPGTTIKRLHGAMQASLSSVKEFREKNDRYIAIEAQRIRSKGWMYWIGHQLLRAIRAQVTSGARLLWLWLLPRSGTRLPLAHEFARMQVRWRLVWASRPT